MLHCCIYNPDHCAEFSQPQQQIAVFETVFRVTGIKTANALKNIFTYR